MDKLIAETKIFLQGSKLAESLSPELANELYCPISLENGENLESVLAEALVQGRDVVVAGTAGGGKTMLLNQILRKIDKPLENLLILDETENLSLLFDKKLDNKIIIIRDLTALDSSEVLRIISSKDRGPMLVAANEGALLDKNYGGYFNQVIQDLHQIQSGWKVNENNNAVVLDMAAVDPVNYALKKLLTHPLLHSAVLLAEEEKGIKNSIRIQALVQLNDPKNAEAIAGLIRSAIGPGEITFREMWNFISDIFLEGENESVPPTSVWFWRLFKGQNQISKIVSEVLKPEFLAFPHKSFAMFHGDIQSLQLQDKLSGLWIHPGANAIDCQNEIQKNNLIQWIRIQYAFLDNLFTKPKQSIFVGSFSTNLYTRVAKKLEKISLIQALNSYFRRKQPLEGDSPELELWIDPMVERRENRSLGSVSLGNISASQLELIKSKAIANLSNYSLEGSKLFLQPTSDKVLTFGGLEITGKLFRALAKGRPNSHYDRENDDVELAIKKFYFLISNNLKIEQNDVLSFLNTPHDGISREYKWKIQKPISNLGV